MKHLFFILFISMTFVNSFTLEANEHEKRMKVACIGNSITYGTGIKDRVKDSYPAQLQKMLGETYEVGNFGRPGATLLNKGHRPYVKQPEYQQAKDFHADIAVFHLGINDTDPRNWPNYKDEFVKDYINLIDTFKSINPNLRCIIARMTPIADRHPRFISGTSQWHEQIQQAIEVVAKTTNAELIDFHAPLYPYPFLLPDAIHPNEEGAGILAKVVYAGITGDYGGLTLPNIFTDNMVLQRNQPLRIHGMANAESKITVKFDRQEKHALANNQGYWEVILEPLKAGEGYELEIRTEDEKKIFHNVAVGEVWLCSGQSNMEFMLKQANEASSDLQSTENKSIRLFDMKARWRTNNVCWPQSAIDSINHLQYFASNGWKECVPETASNFSAIAYHFGRVLQDSLQVPVGLICNAVGGATTESWIDRHTLEMEFPAILKDWLNNDYIQDWARGRAATNLKLSTSAAKRHPYEPCYLYESGILPLKGYPIKGVIWYQGESNAHNIEAHEQLFKLLVQSWRKNWKQNTLPFYYVQLSSLNRPSWPSFRDSQRKLMSQIANTGMVVSSDKGDSLDVHPRNKRPIGERLACWALAKEYQYSILPSGPLVESASAKDNRVTVSFKYGEGMHAADGQQTIFGFELAETEGIYFPATATVTNGQIELVASQVKHPHFVRYAWQPFTRANLVNKDNLPASTFKTVIKKASKVQQTQSDNNHIHSTYYYQRATHFELLPTSSKDIIFLGNSITDGAEWSELFSNRHVKNRGISGDTTWGVYDRLHTILKGNPKKIFLLIGINDIGRGRNNQYVIDGIERIVKRVKKEAPRTKLYIQSILPVNPIYQKFGGHTSQWKRIPIINQSIRKIADSEGITYIDLFSKFADTEGKMNKDLTNDGLHLLGKGYEIWKETILPYIN